MHTNFTHYMMKLAGLNPEKYEDKAKHREFRDFLGEFEVHDQSSKRLSQGEEVARVRVDWREEVALLSRYFPSAMVEW